MKDIPIIFSAPMVSALLDGRKTMSRRLALTEKKTNPNVIGIGWGIGPNNKICRPSPWQRVEPGDRLWVREKLQFFGPAGAEASLLNEPLHYAADENPPGFPGPAITCFPEGWRLPKNGGEFIPSIHMPRWASRLTLALTAVKIERLQDISEEDARNEGARKLDDIQVASWPAYSEPCRWSMESPKSTDQCLSTARWAFANYWLKLNGLDSWDANPEVVALTFTVHKTNIDAMPITKAA